jgi:hypothetical protein
VRGASGLPSEGMASLEEAFDRHVFSVGEQDYRWADVVAAARVWGRWDEVSRQTGRGLAAVERLASGEPEVEEAGQAFRYARGLLAAEEMEAWLAHWGVSHADWLGYLRRELARSRQPQAEAKGDSDEGDVWAEAVCSGALAELAWELAARVVAAEANGGGAGPVETDLVRMDEAHAAFIERAFTPEAAAKTLELRNADWVRLSYTALEFPAAAMASEAALCVREDGLTPADVACRAGVPLLEREAFLEDVEPGLSESLLSAPTGELVGPLPVRNGFALLCVNEKVAPTLSDPVIQDRLQEEVPRRALEREVRNRVRWHEHL